MAAQIEPDVEAAVSTLRSAYADELADVAERMPQCRHCETQKYETFLLSTVLRRAFVRASTGAETDPA